MKAGRRKIKIEIIQDKSRRHIPPLLPGPVGDDAFINDDAVNDSAVEEDKEEGEKPRNMKAGRRKIKIEFIQDKSRCHITFSKGKQAL